MRSSIRVGAFLVASLAALACSSSGGGSGSNGYAGSGGQINGAGGGASSGSSGGAANGSGVTQGQPTSLDALAVGAYAQYGSTCSGGAHTSGVAMFLCPGGRLRGAGMLDSATELMCGGYTTAAAVYDNCNDKVGCFPKVKADVKDTLILGGQSDVDPSYQFTMLLVGGPNGPELMRPTLCKDGSQGYVYLERIAGDVNDDYCVSDACPAPGGSGASEGYGECGTDCDCGKCWYCESGTCRFGGEGPYGCYRGCSG